MNQENKVKFKKNFFVDWFEAGIWAFVVVMFIFNYIFQNYMIPSASMENTLLTGDFLLGNKMKYYFSIPKRGDIISFLSPEIPNELNEKARCIKIIHPVYWDKKKNFFGWYSQLNLVKRIIGLPGDKIQIIDKQVIVNGIPYKSNTELFLDDLFIPKEYIQCVWNGDNMGSRDNFKEFIVPVGQYFVMGDNRDNSHDSRFFGCLPKKNITGSPWLIFFSADGYEKSPNLILFNLHDKKWKFRSDRIFKLIK